MRWSDSAYGERRKSDGIDLNPAQDSAETVWGYLLGHFKRLAT
jgi:hypothetical protein